MTPHTARTLCLLGLCLSTATGVQAAASADGAASVFRDSLQIFVHADPGATLALVPQARSSVQTGWLKHNGIDVVGPFQTISPDAPSVFSGNGPGYAYGATADSTSPTQLGNGSVSDDRQGDLSLFAEGWFATFYSVAGGGTGSVTVRLRYAVSGTVDAAADEFAGLRAEAALGAGNAAGWLVPPSKAAAELAMIGGVLQNHSSGPAQGLLQTSFDIAAGADFYIATWAGTQVELSSSALPEPASLGAMLLGLAAVAVRIRRRTG